MFWYDLFPPCFLEAGFQRLLRLLSETGIDHMAHCHSKNAISNSLSPIKEHLAENMYNDDGMLLSYCHMRNHAAFHREMTKIKKNGM